MRHARALPLTALLSLALLGVGPCDPSSEDCLDDPPIPPPAAASGLGGGLDGFESPYLGHTGSWDGKGGGLGGASKAPDMDIEASMGLRWTFMPVYWAKLEPDGPVDLGAGIPPAAWRSLDDFVVAAHARGLNVLMQAPVFGGNAGAPPAWAGLREAGKSAPADMAAAADFARKLAHRYKPGGTLALAQGWGDTYGVRAFEIDNEPSSYKTHWEDQAGDYAEMLTLVAAALRGEDPQAVIVAPALACCGGDDWLAATLTGAPLSGSPTYVANGVPYAIGPDVDAVSFHVYESLNDTTVDCALSDRRATFEAHEAAPGFGYARKEEYWHTEGNYDFFHSADETLRARWFPQMFTRAFAAGVRKVNVMDATPGEQVAVRTYVSLLPDPFPMRVADAEVGVGSGEARAFRHDDPDGGRVWILWAEGDGPALVTVPAQGPTVTLVTVDGAEEPRAAVGGWVDVELQGDPEIAPPVMVVDRG